MISAIGPSIVFLICVLGIIVDNESRILWIVASLGWLGFALTTAGFLL